MADELNNEPHIIVYGNPIDGLFFIGPFATREAAMLRGNTDGNLDADWWVAQLEAIEA